MKQQNVLSFRDKHIGKTIYGKAAEAKKRLISLAKDKQGLSALEIVIGIVISVGAAAILITTLNGTLPNFLNSIFTRLGGMLGV